MTLIQFIKNNALHFTLKEHSDSLNQPRGILLLSKLSLFVRALIPTLKELLLHVMKLV